MTSTRLSGDAAVQGRLFPKMRSWATLGMPLELLSPLSVLRVVFPVFAVLWCAEAALLHWPGEHTGWVYAIAAVAVAVWLALLVPKELGPGWCQALAGLGTLLVAGLVLAGHGAGAALGFAPFGLPLLVFVALFLTGRAVVLHLAAAVLLLWLVLWPSIGVGYAAAVAAVAAVASSAAPLAVALLAAAAGRTGAVDPDTGLPNALGLARRLAGTDRGHPLLLATVHLAGVDEAREALGHGVGSELLRRVVEDLGQVLPSDAVIARVEGDELVVGYGLPAGTIGDAGAGAGGGASTATGAGGSDGAGPADLGAQAPAGVQDAGRSLARALLDAVAGGRYVVGGRVELSVRAHVGLAFAPWDGTTLAELLRRSSLAARQASTTGQPVEAWESPQGTLTAEDLALLSALRLAPERGELRLVFQPQVEAGTGRTVSAEVLLRWWSAELGEVPPGRFIVLAERTGYVDRLTEWILSEALDAQVRWRQAGILVRVSVNVSAMTLRRPDLPTWILHELDSRSLPPSSLAVEVTETAATELLPAVRLLRPLHERGVRVSIDDFGSGHTSLSALPHLPLDEIKVDMSFVLRSGQSPADQAIVHSVLDLAHRLGLDAVAEGVEDEDVQRRMTDLGFDLLQGYHLSKPLPEEEFLAYARASGCETAPH